MTQMHGSLWNVQSYASIKPSPQQSLNVKNRHLHPANGLKKNKGEGENDALKDFALYMSSNIQDHMTPQKAAVEHQRHANASQNANQDMYQDLLNHNQCTDITRT